MEKRHKAYIKLNIISLIFLAVSLISVTLAWFAYGGLANVVTEIDVKAWYIELESGGETITNEIILSLSEIYPGMETMTEKVKLTNLGDSDAVVNYEILSARIMGNSKDEFENDGEAVTSSFIEDKLSHEYPFKINIGLTRNYALAHGGESEFEISISWPLDSGDDALDSHWGSEAFRFNREENEQKELDETYMVRPAIQVVVSLMAEQYLEIGSASDPDYNLGDIIFYEVNEDRECFNPSATCIKTYVIDANNTLEDQSVSLLVDPLETYLTSTYNEIDIALSQITSSWNVSTRFLNIEDILKVISRDKINSKYKIEDLSNQIIGNLNYGNRLSEKIEKVTQNNGYFVFNKERYEYLNKNTCYWIDYEYNQDKAFSIKSYDLENIKLYGENKTSTCSVIPVIEMQKN